MRQLFFLAFATLALTGCVSGTMSKLPESHPASPHAEQSSQAPDPQMLVAGSQGLVLPVSTNQTEMQRGQHQQTPAAKGAQPPSEHKHGDEPPKQEENK